MLEAEAGLKGRYRIKFRLFRSRFTRLASSPLGHVAPPGKYRRPRDIRAVTGGAGLRPTISTLFFQQLIGAMSSARWSPAVHASASPTAISLR